MTDCTRWFKQQKPENMKNLQTLKKSREDGTNILSKEAEGPYTRIDGSVLLVKEGPDRDNQESFIRNAFVLLAVVNKNHTQMCQECSIKHETLGTYTYHTENDANDRDLGLYCAWP